MMMQFKTSSAMGKIWSLVLLAVMLTGTAALADEPVWKALAVYPPKVQLSTHDDYQGVVVVATRSDGVTADVTADAEFSLADE